MMKKKMGFGLGHLRMASKPSNRPYETDDGWPDGEDDELEYISQVDTPFICRPPKLDAHTERELKRACAVILENLKPSGYDIEDTRMKSDILVNNPALQKKYLGSQQQQPQQQQQQQQKQKQQQQQQQPPRRPQVAAPWNLGGAVDQSSSFVDSSRIIRDLEKRERPIKEGHRNDHKTTSKPAGLQYHHSHHSNHPHPLQSQPTHTIAVVENPLAPAPTAVQPTPLKSQASHTRLPQAHRGGSSSTVSSNNPGSAYDSRSEATNVTSTAITPSSGSKRISDNDDDHQQKIMSADSKTSEWMKETVNKRLRAENTAAAYSPKESSESTTTAATATTTHQSPTAQPKRSWGLFSKQDKKPAAAQVQTVVNGHATKISISRPKSSNELRTHLANDSQPPELTNPKSSSAKSVSLERPGSSGSLRSHLNLFKSARLNEISQDAPASPRVRKEEIPPVPSIARIKDLDGLYGDSAQRSPSLLSSFTQALPKHDDAFFLSETSPTSNAPSEKKPEPPPPPKSSSRPLASASQSPAVAQSIISPRIVRQEVAISNNNSSPSTASFASPKSPFGDVSVKKPGRPAATADPEAADFDFLMGFMQDKSEQQDRLTNGNDATTRAKSFTVNNSAVQRPVNGQKQMPIMPRSSSHTPSKISSELSRPNTSGLASNNHHFIITNHSRVHTSSGLPTNSRLSTDPQAAHYLYGPGGAGLKSSEGGGVKKFFKRLGGGGDGTPRNVYVPSRDPYRKYNDERSDDEGDWDEEACAAPVVGFGRGR